MVHIQEQTTIDRPIEEVFDYLTDIPRQTDWASAVQSSTVTSSGPIGEGTSFRQTVKAIGRTFDAQMKVTAYERPDRYAFAGSSGPMQANMSFDLTPEGNGTRVVHTFDGESAGFFKLADPLVARTMSKQFQADLETLKTMLEGGVAAQSAQS